MMSFEELENHSDRRDPRGTVKLFLQVLHGLSTDENAARELIPLFLPKPSLKADPRTKSGFAIGLSDEYYVAELLKKPNIMRSYFGGTPENDYVPVDGFEPLFVDGRPTVIEEKEAKIFVRSLGKEFPSPVSLKRNSDGVWKVFSWSSIATGVKTPTAEAEDF